MTTTRHTPKKAFTLIETMVSIALLTLAVSGAFLVANSAMIAAEIARDKLTASYLAQEAVEYVRMMRDNEYLASYANGGSGVSDNAWHNFLKVDNDADSMNPCKEPSGSTQYCQLDPLQPVGVSGYAGGGNSLTICQLGISCTPLYLSDGVYTQQAVGTQTPFTRTVRVTDIPGVPDGPYVPGPDKIVTSTVFWFFHGIYYQVSISEHITPWQ